jgi:hypothetical protein
MTNYSTRIARVKANLEILLDLDPTSVTGWESHPVVTRYRLDPYSLNHREFAELERFLKGAKDEAIDLKYHQISFFEDQDYGA